MIGRSRGFLAAVAGVLALLSAGAARAQDTTAPFCNDAAVGPNPIYLAGSSAFVPTAQAVAIQLSALTGNDRATLIYKSSASCDGVTAIVSGGTLAGTASYFAIDSSTNMPAPETCNLPDNVKADVGVSDIFFETCPGFGARPANVGDIGGPVQAMLFIVPDANKTFTALSAEMGQLIWGCGQAGGVSPFTDENGIMQRNSSSGTQGIIAKVIGVPATAFKGRMNNASTDLLTALMTYAMSNPQKAIGFLAADAYDLRRDSLNSVAFQGFGQKKAYYADSSALTFDKRNVRDGHYVAWGPEHMIVALGSDGKPSDPSAVKWLGWLDGSIKTGNIDFTKTMAQAGVIPQCAMKVKRSADGGPVSPYTDPDPCGCFFESVTTNMATPAGCTPCTDNTPCTNGKTCHHNFCE